MSRINKLENIYKEQLEKKDIKNISDFIHSIVDVDITKGKYARFLIEAFLNDKFLEEDLIGGLNSTVGQAISLFDKHKGKLPLEHRSVYALDKETGEALYQSPGDLWSNVKQYQGELSGKELKKEEQEQVYRETEFVYKDEETGFQIISPLTEESAKWWGKGTRWCTSAENNTMFWDYAEKSPLLILLMPNGNKLQLWNNDNDIQFMNEADNEVELKYIEQHWKLLEPICRWLNDLKFVPKQYQIYELCELAIKKNGLALECVSNKIKNITLCREAVKQNGKALDYVPEKLKTPELCEMAVKQNGISLISVPEYLKTYELCKIAVSNNGCSLEYVPNTFLKRYKDYSICELAVKQNGLALCYVPSELKTKEICKLAVKNNGRALLYVPSELKTKEMCELAVKNNGISLQYTPKEHKDYNFCMEAIKNNGISLQYTPKEHKDYNLCMEAIKNNGYALYFSPENRIDYNLCMEAVKQNGSVIMHPILKTFIDYNLCLEAAKQDKHALVFFSHKYKTEFLKNINIKSEYPKDIYQNSFSEIRNVFSEKELSLKR